MHSLHFSLPNVHDGEVTREAWDALLFDLRNTDTFPDESPEIDLAATWEPSEDDAAWWAMHAGEDVILDDDLHPYHATGEGVTP